MRHSGWTGVQYSIFRICLAGAVAQFCNFRLDLAVGPAWILFFLGQVGAIALAFGWRDHAVTINLLALVGGLGAITDGAPLVLPQPDTILLASLLVLHLFAPVSPFGSWDARGRIDPRGDWSRPVWLGHLSWAWLAMIYLDRAIIHYGVAARTTAELDFAIPSLVTALLELAFVVATFKSGWRAPTWVALTLWQIAWLAAFGLEPGDGVLLLLHIIAADPGWWAGKKLSRAERPGTTSNSARLFYDGDCGFCHRSVRFVLSEELGTPDALKLRFAPLQSDLFTQTIALRDDLDADLIPDSIILILEDGTPLRNPPPP